MEFFVFGSEAFQQGKLDLILLPSAGAFAGNDVAQVRDGKNAFHDRPRSGLRKIGNAIGGKHQIHIKRTGFDLAQNPCRQ